MSTNVRTLCTIVLMVMDFLVLTGLDIATKVETGFLLCKHIVNFFINYAITLSSYTMACFSI